MKNFLFLFIFCFFSAVVISQPRPEPFTYYNDYVGFGGPPNAESILSDFHAKDSVLCVVMIVDVGYDAGSLQEYALNIGNKWGLYKVGRDAIVIALCPKERRIDIQVSRSLGPILTDGICGQIARDGLKILGQKKRAEGVLFLIQECQKKIRAEKQRGNAPAPMLPLQIPDQPFDWIFWLGLLLGGGLTGFGGVRSWRWYQEKKERERQEAEDAERRRLREIQEKEWAERERLRIEWEQSPEGKAELAHRARVAEEARLKAEEMERLRRIAEKAAYEKRVKEEKEAAEKHRLFLLTPEGKEWAIQEEARKRRMREEEEEAERRRKQRREEEEAAARKRREQEDEDRRDRESASSSYSSYSSGGSSSSWSSSNDTSSGSSSGFGGDGGGASGGGDW